MARQRTGGRAGKAKKSASSRRNYAPVEAETGFGKLRPTGWANWLGFVLFGLITVALAAETVSAVAESRGTDPIAAGVMTLAFAWMTYLFATTRRQDAIG